MMGMPASGPVFSRAAVAGVVGGDHQAVLGELGVDVVHLDHCSYGTLASAKSTFMCPGMRPATGWMAYFTSVSYFWVSSSANSFTTLRLRRRLYCPAR